MSFKLHLKLLPAAMSVALCAAWCTSVTAAPRGTGHWVGLMDCQLAKLDDQGKPRPSIQVEIATEIGRIANAHDECFKAVHIKRGMLTTAGWVCQDRGAAHCVDSADWKKALDTARERRPLGRTYLRTIDFAKRLTVLTFMNEGDMSSVCEALRDGVQAYLGDKKDGSQCVNPAKRPPTSSSSR